jgi:hypothetical protein
MQTPDGSVRVEAVCVGRRYWYRVRVGETVHEPMSIAAVGRLLAEVGVDGPTWWRRPWRSRRRPHAVPGYGVGERRFVATRSARYAV